jgi:branched-chain amino acid transport system ATP-binding protein
MRRLARDLLIPAGHASARLNRQHDRVAEVIDRCGLGGVADELAGALPIGKLRLLELARAMVASPAVLLLDEPTSGLGDEERQNFGELVRELLRDARPAVLLVEHDVDFVMALVDRILVLETGRVLAVGDAAEVMKDPAVLSAYIGRSEDDGARVGRSLA